MKRRDSWQHRVRARRSRRRGAAMVEALVAIPFFIIIFASSMFVGKFYNEKLRTIAQSRQKAWVAAEASCDGSSAGDLNIIDSGQLGMMSSSPLAALCDKGFGSASYSSRSSVTPSSVLGFGTKNLMFTTKMTCDETPATGDFKGAVDFLWDYFGPPSGTPTAIDISAWFLPFYGAYGVYGIEPF